MRSGVPVLTSANNSATVPLYRATVCVGVKAVMSATAVAMGSQKISLRAGDVQNLPHAAPPG